MPRLQIQVMGEPGSAKNCFPAQLLGRLAQQGRLKWYDERQLGNCYEVALELLITLAEARVEHGWAYVDATLESGIHHAWLEWGEWVIDFSSGTQFVVPKDDYYCVKKPVDDRRVVEPAKLFEIMSTEEGRRDFDI